MKKSKKLTTLIAILSAFALTGCDLNSLSLDSIKDMGKNFSLMDLVDPLGWVHNKEDKPKEDNHNNNNNDDDDGGDTTVAVTSVTISPSALSLGVNETKTLTANVLPENATNKTVTWASTNNEVATVTNGTVKGIKAGSATIKATSGGRTGECTVTVTGNQDTPPIGEIITPQTAIELMDAAGEGKVVQTLVKVKGVVAAGSSYNSAYKEYSGTFEGVNNFVLEFTDPNNILNGASADGVEVVVEGYIEKYQGNYKMAYLPANISPTGAKTTPVLVSAQAVQHEGTLTSITVSNVHRSFFVGNSFINETVTAHYSDGSTAVVNATFTGYNMSQAGTQTVTVSYTENGVTQTTTYSITVTEKGPVEGSITYTFTNDKTSAQNMGTWTSEQFMQHVHSDGGDVITGMKPSPVNAYIGANGGSGDATWELWNCLKVGKSSAKGEITLLLDSSVNFTSIKVNAIGSRDDGTLTINDVTKNVTKKALKTDLNPVEIEFEVQGGISELKISSKDAASNNYAISITSIEFVGASTATAKELTSISIEGSLTKSSYIEGEAYSSAGLSVKGHYDDGSENDVAATITLSKTVAAVGDTSIVATASFNGKEATKTLQVSVQAAPEIASISIEGSIKTEYHEGEVYSTDGLSVKAHYSDGSSATVAGTISLNKQNAELSDTQIVANATFNGFNADPVTFTVHVLENGAISSSPIDLGGSYTIVYNETSYEKAIKAGSSKVAGEATIKVPAGATKLTFFAAGWNGENVTLTITGGSVNQSVSLTADSGVAGSETTLTISVNDDSKFKKEFDIPGSSSEITLAVKATAGKRFVIWNASYSQ